MAGSVAVSEQDRTLTPDLCVIGGGTAGIAVAMAAALFGVPVVLVERDRLGGDRSRSVIAALGGLAERCETVSPETADQQIHDHVQRFLVAQDRNYSRERLTALGIRVIEGEARFVSRSMVRVGGQTIKARRFVIATGVEFSRPDGSDAITPEALSPRVGLPQRPLVLGGGATAVELAQALQRLGAEVTLAAPEALLPSHDPEGVALLRRALLRDGVTIREDAGDTTENGNHDAIILAGRPDAAIAALDLDLAGIERDADGIRVDRRMLTSNRRVYAIGSCISGADREGDAALTTHQAGIVLRRSLFRLPARARQRGTAMVATSPALARTGLDEAQARAKSARIGVLRWPYADNDHARAAGEADGFVKLLTDGKGRILGGSVAGARAGEVIALIDLAMRQKLDVATLSELILPQASYAEVARRAALSWRTPMANRPGIRRLIGFLRRFG